MSSTWLAALSGLGQGVNQGLGNLLDQQERRRQAERQALLDARQLEQMQQDQQYRQWQMGQAAKDRERQGRLDEQSTKHANLATLLDLQGRVANRQLSAQGAYDMAKAQGLPDLTYARAIKTQMQGPLRSVDQVKYRPTITTGQEQRNVFQDVSVLPDYEALRLKMQQEQAAREEAYRKQQLALEKQRLAAQQAQQDAELQARIHQWGQENSLADRKLNLGDWAFKEVIDPTNGKTTLARVNPTTGQVATTSFGVPESNAFLPTLDASGNPTITAVGRKTLTVRPTGVTPTPRPTPTPAPSATPKPIDYQEMVQRIRSEMMNDPMWRMKASGPEFAAEFGRRVDEQRRQIQTASGQDGGGALARFEAALARDRAARGGK